MASSSEEYASLGAPRRRHGGTFGLNPLVVLFGVPFVSLLLWYIVPLFTSPLNKYPGPFLASFTNYWRMYQAYDGQLHDVSKKLHDKYGPVVRMAPNYLDLDCPSLIKTCFDIHGVWRKTEWHGVSGVKVGNKVLYNIFSECNPHEHARIKKPIAKYFAPRGVLPFEPHVDCAIACLVNQLDERFAGKGKFGDAFDFGEWAMFFAWDAVAKSTWSKRVGYLDKGFDFDGTLETSEKAADYLAVVGMQPKLDNFFDKNPVYRIGPPAFGNITQVGLGHLMARYQKQDGHDPEKPDFLDRYLEAAQEYPDVVDDQRILSYLLVNLAAGADTTAVSLRSIFYLTHKHPAVWKRLEKEVLATPFTQLPVPYSECRSIPYLEAVIKEALRVYPGNCFAQERYVPAGGLTLPDGSFVPEGTAVGFNAYVIHRNKTVWGEDAAEFRPERWLKADSETDDEFAERLRIMNNSDLSFGWGSRKCIGMNLGMMEVFKTVATLVAYFEFELADPKADWHFRSAVFPRQTGIIHKLKKRDNVQAPFNAELADDS